MENRSCSPSSSTPTLEELQDTKEKDGTKTPSLNTNLNKSRYIEITISSEEDSSLTTSRGNEEEMNMTEDDREETEENGENRKELKIPRKPNEEERGDSDDQETQRTEERMSTTPTGALKVRIHAKEDTEEILEKLRKQLKEDIQLKENKIDSVNNAIWEEDHHCECTEEDRSMIEVINIKKEEAELENSRKLKEAIDMLDTTIGADTQNTATSEQERALEDFSKAIDSLGDKKEEYNMREQEKIEDSGNKATKEHNFYY